ncbi:ABC transporter permease [Stagnihabitans tardus]|uniref:ABC transporter permease subunit n=1 Tax=Stagnihabitans tardus TaxID=2699202 RepID=A0AAE4YAQ3_9RHOB|nr:ABC transporter permease subunit [Stagnihabitans tardus]NBZ89131.1 ABC transporter permease subunit [Stagnihabitans tardus]
MTAILALALSEFRIGLRNRWLAIAMGLMVVFALVLSAAGSGPTGSLGVDRLSVTVASLTSLSVYLVPLMALLMSFDAVAGEVERGTLALILTYPLSRGQLLAGKALAHLAILSLAMVAGFGAAGVLAAILDPRAVEGLPALVRLVLSSIALGATFLGLGYAISARARRPSGAAGLAVGLWLLAVVLYDLGLLAAVVADNGGAFTLHVFPLTLLANPADAFRLYNLAASQATGAAAGVASAASSVPVPWSALSVALWPFLAFGLALVSFRKVQP